ncbi:MAG: hypothetical protein JNM72_17680 [Deltaproteobacteria bacterium]|nr:hypothetical protein [Deltaproteobacteria bacterium]
MDNLNPIKTDQRGGRDGGSPGGATEQDQQQAPSARNMGSLIGGGGGTGSAGTSTPPGGGGTGSAGGTSLGGSGMRALLPPRGGGDSPTQGTGPASGTSSGESAGTTSNTTTPAPKEAPGSAPAGGTSSAETTARAADLSGGGTGTTTGAGPGGASGAGTTTAAGSGSASTSGTPAGSAGATSGTAATAAATTGEGSASGTAGSTTGTAGSNTGTAGSNTGTAGSTTGTASSGAAAASSGTGAAAALTGSANSAAAETTTGSGAGSAGAATTSGGPSSATSTGSTSSATTGAGSDAAIGTTASSGSGAASTATAGPAQQTSTAGTGGSTGLDAIVADSGTGGAAAATGASAAATATGATGASAAATTTGAASGPSGDATQNTVEEGTPAEGDGESGALGGTSGVPTTAGAAGAPGPGGAGPGGAADAGPGSADPGALGSAPAETVGTAAADTSTTAVATDGGQQVSSPSLDAVGGLDAVIPTGGGPTEDKAQAGGGGETGAVEVGGAGGGAGPVALTLPQDASQGTADAVLAATGDPLTRHMADVQARLDQVQARAQSLQETAMTQAMAMGAQVRAFTQAEGAGLGAHLDQISGNLAGVFASSRQNIVGAAASARAAVAGAESSTRARIGEAAERNAANVQALYRQQRALYKNLQPQLFAPFQKLIGEYAGLSGTDSKAIAETFCDLNIQGAVGARDNSALEKFTGPLRVEFVNGKMEKARAEMISGGEKRATETRAGEAQSKAEIAALIQPLDANVEGLAVSGAATVRAARKAAEKKLAADVKGANETINAAEQSSLAELNSVESAISAELSTLRGHLAAEMEARGQIGDVIALAAGQDLRGQFDQVLAGIAAQLPSGGVTREAAEPLLAAAEAQLDQLAGLQQAQLAALLGEMLGSYSEGVQGTRAGVDALATNASAAIQGTASQKVAGFGTIGQRFAEVVGMLAPSVDSTVGQWIQPISGRLAAQASQLRGVGSKAASAARGAAKSSHDSYTKDQKGVVSGFLAKITPKALAAGQSAGAAAQDRAKQAFQAMRGMGTDENGIYNALRNMKEGEPAVTKEEFMKLTGGETLDSWLRYEFSGTFGFDQEGYDIAKAHLERQHGRAARLEIKYNCHWYGDDKAQMEKVLRGLPKEEREKMAAAPEWKGTRDLLQSRLKGNDLDVAKALINNNVARADAIRLKETIDKARQKRDDDAVHDALAGMDQDQLAAIAEEFVTLKGVTNAGAAPLKGDFARAEMAKYVTRDIERVPGMRGERKMDKSSKDLATDLIVSGKESMEVRVSSFEREMNRKGGPDAVRLEKALYANDALSPSETDDAPLSERLHSPDKDVREAAQKQAKAQQEAFEKSYEERYKKKASASLSGQKDLSKEKKNLYGMMMEDGFNSTRVAKTQIQMAVDGAGTDEDAVKRALKGMSPNDIKELKQAYPNLEADLGVNGKGGFFTELSGQDRIDVEVMLMGDEAHLNDDEKYALAARKMNDQLGTGGGVSGDIEKRALKANWDELRDWKAAHKADFKDGTFQGDPKDYDKYLLMCRRVGISAELYQEQSDRITNYITTGIAIVGAIAATVITAGAASPFLAAALTTGATGLTTMAVKAGMKGDRYGWEEAATDGAKVAVESMTAGFGAHLARGAEGLKGMEKLAYLTKTGAASGGLNSLSSSLLDEKTYKDGFDWGGVALNTAGGILGGGATGYFAGKSGIRSEGYDDATSFGTKLADNTKWGALEGLTTGTISTLTDKDVWEGKKETEDIMWKVGGSTLGGTAKGVTGTIADKYVGDDGSVTKAMKDKDEAGNAITPTMGKWGGSFLTGLGKGTQSFADKSVETALNKETWEDDDKGISEVFHQGGKSGLSSFASNTAGTRYAHTDGSKAAQDSKNPWTRGVDGFKQGALESSLSSTTEGFYDLVRGKTEANGRATGLDAFGLNVLQGTGSGAKDGFLKGWSGAYKDQRKEERTAADALKAKQEADANSQGVPANGATGQGTTNADPTKTTAELDASKGPAQNDPTATTAQKDAANPTPETDDKQLEALKKAQVDLEKTDQDAAKKVTTLQSVVDQTQVNTVDGKGTDPSKGPPTDQIKTQLKAIDTQIKPKIDAVANLEKKNDLPPITEEKRKKRPNKGTGTSAKKSGTYKKRK